MSHPEQMTTPKKIRAPLKTRMLRVCRWMMQPEVLSYGAITLGLMAIVICTLALNAGSDDTTSDWVTAFGTVLGSLITGGALLVAAQSYRKQVSDKHQELHDKHQSQAVAVTVGYEAHPQFTSKYLYFVKNGSNAGIYNIKIFAINDQQKPSNSADVVPPGDRLDFEMAGLRYRAAAEFDDSAGVRWRRDSVGLLEELN